MTQKMTRIEALTAAIDLLNGNPVEKFTNEDVLAKLGAMLTSETRKAIKAAENASKNSGKKAAENLAKAKEIADAIAAAGTPVRTTWVGVQFGLLSPQKVGAVMKVAVANGLVQTGKLGKHVVYYTPGMEFDKDTTPLS